MEKERKLPAARKRTWFTCLNSSVHWAYNETYRNNNLWAWNGVQQIAKVITMATAGRERGKRMMEWKNIGIELQNDTNVILSFASGHYIEPIHPFDPTYCSDGELLSYQIYSPRRRTTIVLDFIILVRSVSRKSGFGIWFALFNVLPINEYKTVITINGMMKKATVDMIIKFSQTRLGALKGSPHQAESGNGVSSFSGCGLWLWPNCDRRKWFVMRLSHVDIFGDCASRW